MVKGPVKKGRQAPRLNVRTAEDEDPGLKTKVEQRARLDTLDVSRRGWGPVTGRMVITDADGVERTVAYEQGMGKGRPSRLYDHLKVRILRPGEQPIPTPLQAKADAAAKQTVTTTESLDEDDEADPPMDLSAIEDEAEDDDVDVNLTAWAEGNAKYRWAQVRDAIEKRFSMVVNSDDEARDFLAGQGIGRVSKRNAAPEVHAPE